MQINATWHRPIKLISGAAHNLIFFFSVKEIPNKHGCYIFYNQHGRSFSILYIGRADNLQRRLTQQMNNLKLMMGIQKKLSGKKYLIYCTVQVKRGQKILKMNSLIERNLIKTALSNGAELLNKQGTQIHYDSIIFKGNRESEQLVGRKINVGK